MNITNFIEERDKIFITMRNAYAEVYPESACAKHNLMIERISVGPVSNREGMFVEFQTEEYNEACHCHPEYTRDDFIIPLDIANTMDMNTIVAYLKQKRADDELKRKKWQEKYERDERARQEKYQREQYETLKKKFEGK